jgi:surfeit locus 1 family protein
VKRVALFILVALGVAGLSALGVWQIERRAWKLALIERVEQRVHAPPIGAPGPNQWSRLTRDNSEYLHVSVSGHFIEGREALVKAVTDLGSGCWVLAPLQTDEGFVVLVNRGFVSSQPATSMTENGGTTQSCPTADSANSSAARIGTITASATAAAPISITGLLRMTEPKGGFLRSNDPARNQWYSRDVQAISHALGLTGTAPYFIDAEASPAGSSSAAGNRPGGTPPARDEPVPGLTVISFHNSHLVYATTWFSLALMVVALGIRMARHR